MFKSAFSIFRTNKSNIQGLNRQMNIHISPMQLSWATLDIFLHIAFSWFSSNLGLQFVHSEKSRTLLHLFCGVNYLVACFRVFIDPCYICFIYVWIQNYVRNPYMQLNLTCKEYWRRYRSLKMANVCQFKKRHNFQVNLRHVAH